MVAWGSVGLLLERGDGHQTGAAYQSLHGSVQHISVVAAELGVGAVERRVTGSLGLLDTVGRETQPSSANQSRVIFILHDLSQSIHSSIVAMFVASWRCRWREVGVALSHVPVTVSLLALVVLRRVLGLYLRGGKGQPALNRAWKSIWRERLHVLAIVTAVCGGYKGGCRSRRSVGGRSNLSSDVDFPRFSCGKRLVGPPYISTLSYPCR